VQYEGTHSTQEKREEQQMTTSPYDYVTIIEHEINRPESFLPTALHYQKDELIWNKLAYATYGKTPVDRETIDSSFLCDEESIKIPPYMEEISRTNSMKNHQRDYITEYKLTAATLDHWYHHKLNDDRHTMDAIETWKSTCNKLTQNPFFSTGWNLPVFYPIYSYQCMAGLQVFF
jgi:hypothetical protein